VDPSQDEASAPHGVRIRIGDRDFTVPPSMTVLGSLRYLRTYDIEMGGFCWNAECRTCEVDLRLGSAPAYRALSCQTLVVSGMTVVSMTDKLRFCLRNLGTKP